MKKRNSPLLNKILLIAFGMATFSEGIILPIYAIFVQKIGGDVLDAGIALGIFFIAESVFTYFIHRSKKTHKQKINLMVSGWSIWMIGILMYLVIFNKWILFFAQVFLALGNAFADPIYDEEYASNTKTKSEEKEWGLFEGSQAFVNGISVIIGGIITSLFGINILIYTMVAVATISFTLILYYAKKTIRKH